MTKKILAIVLGLAVVFSAGAVLAGNTSGPANYQVTLQTGCIINALMAPNFGMHALGSSDISGIFAGQLEVSCTNGMNYMWGIDSGLHVSGGTTLMSNGTDTVTYVLYESGSPIGDSGLNAMDGSYTEKNPNPSRTNTGTGAIQIYSMSVDVFISAATSPGLYTDTITYSVVWP